MCVDSDVLWCMSRMEESWGRPDQNMVQIHEAIDNWTEAYW